MDPVTLPEPTGRPAFRGGLPPGPRNKIVQTLLYMRDPYAYHESCVRRFGELYSIPSIIGTVVMTSHPDGARTMFTLEADHYGAFGVDAILPIVGPGSVLLLSGERHRRERKLLGPPLHGARLRAYGEMMRQSALTQACGWKAGQVIDMQEAMQSLSLQVILRTVFGIVEPQRATRFAEAISRYLHAGSPLLLFFPVFQRELFGLGPWAQFRRAKAHVNELIYQQIAATRQSRTTGEDILSLLLASSYEDGSTMTDSDVRDELLTLLLAGHETTAQALSWALYYLHRAPATRARLLAEIDALGADAEPEAIAAQPYLEAVCHEALRLNPIVAEAARMLHKPLSMAGYTLPPGTTLGASVIGIHRRPELYPEPESFRPERFLERKFSPFEFLPFGGGGSRCLGSAFALYEMKLVLFALLGRYTLSLTSDRPIVPVLRGLTLGPRGGVPMRVEGARTGR